MDGGLVAGEVPVHLLAARETNRSPEMGVPAFFRWLSRKYSSIIVHCVEEKGKECNGVRIPVDTTKPNPNEVEFDNLYLDMNGIIHPCTHPEDKPAPKNEDEMMVAIFEYIDRLFNIVRPRRVLYMAIDGVAVIFHLRRSKRGLTATASLQSFLSDASVPGEGEHKIMDYIRRQRAQPNHDPNTHHCLCGADADLIMLGLATHEPNFTIIREEFKPNKPRPCALCGQIGHEIKDCQGVAREKQGQVSADCFLEGAIDRLVNIYKDVVHKTGGYLTENGYVNLERVEMIMQAVGVAEDNIFKKRKEDDESFKRRMKEKRKRAKQAERGPAYMTTGQFAPQALGRRDRPEAVQNARHQAFDMRMQSREQHNKIPSGSGGCFIA
ncbi:5'-3' exoribonuclease 2 [Larimichthys crocea]|uniref:Uncharacterized protein n=1 Tax=Larimichthys crocea TaxID=215358 RepID=A0ACD3QYH0_LARCR|nr:5'-3' exoribonuclease 2 [Larimichthys crocea]